MNSPGDGFFLVIIAEGPVAEHLEEGVVGVVTADIVQVVVLACHAHAFLGVDGARIRPLVGSQENILELHHPGIGKEKGLVAAGNQGGRRHEGVSLLNKKIDEILADFRASEFFHSHTGSKTEFVF